MWRRRPTSLHSYPTRIICEYKTFFFIIIFIVPNQYTHDPTISPLVPPRWGKVDSPGLSPNPPQTQTKSTPCLSTKAWKRPATNALPALGQVGQTLPSMGGTNTWGVPGSLLLLTSGLLQGSPLNHTLHANPPGDTHAGKKCHYKYPQSSSK